MEAYTLTSYIIISLFSYLDIPYCAASSHSPARCYNRYISTSFPHSRSDCYTESQIWNTSNFLKFSTEAIASSCYTSRIEVSVSLISICVHVIFLWPLPRVKYSSQAVIMVPKPILNFFYEPWNVFPRKSISQNNPISNFYS